MGALTLPGGVFGDIFGRHRVYLRGLAVFSLGAVWASIAPSLGLLIAARVAMGVGAAMVMSGTLSLISAMIQGREQATAIGLWRGMNAMARQVGGAIGIALLTAILAGRFQSQLTIALAGGHLSPGERARVGAAAANIAGGVAGGNGGAQATRVHDLIQVAFTQGMTDTLRVFAIVSALGVLAALLIRRSDFAAARTTAPTHPPALSTPAAAGSLAEAVAR